MFSPLVTNLFQHGFRGVNLQKWSDLRFLKTQMTKFYFPHVQMVLKIGSSPVKTRFSRLDQSRSWIFMKCAVIKITAYWGWTPPQKLDIICKNNYSWPTTKGEYFKTGGRYSFSCCSRIDPRPVFSCYGPLWGGISKKIFDQHFPWIMPGLWL